MEVDEREATRLGKFRANSDGQNNTTTGKEGTKVRKSGKNQRREAQERWKDEVS